MFVSSLRLKKNEKNQQQQQQEEEITPRHKMKNKHLVHKRVIKPVCGGFIKSKQLTHTRTHTSRSRGMGYTNKQAIVFEICIWKFLCAYNVIWYYTHSFLVSASQPANQLFKEINMSVKRAIERKRAREGKSDFCWKFHRLFHLKFKKKIFQMKYF